MTVFYDAVEPESVWRDRLAFLEHPELKLVPWSLDAADQREKMLNGCVYVAAQVETPWYLKLDVDVVAEPSDHWFDPSWFEPDQRGRNPVFVASPWAFTKPARWIEELERWSGRVPELAGRPSLGLAAPEGATRLRHRRIISYCFFGKTDWTRQMAAYCSGRLPVPSQDTFLWYCAAKRGDFYRSVRMNAHGWRHVPPRKLPDVAKKAIYMPPMPPAEQPPQSFASPHLRVLARLMSRFTGNDGELRGAEIGVAKGATSEGLLRRFGRLHLTMVDSWTVYGPQHPYRLSRDGCSQLSSDEQTTRARLAESRTAFAGNRRCILRSDSALAAKAIQDGSLDVVFIDADHTYEGVSKDLRAWWPKVRLGGLFCGHDYGGWADRVGIWGVKRAVDEFAAEQTLTVGVGRARVWYVIRPAVEAKRVSAQGKDVDIQVVAPRQGRFPKNAAPKKRQDRCEAEFESARISQTEKFMLRRHNRIQVRELSELLPENGVFIDVGGFVGNFTEYLTRVRRCRAILFEPVRGHFEFCRRRFATKPEVVVEQLALSDAPGEAVIYRGHRNLAWNTMVADMRNARNSRLPPERVSCVKFDDYWEGNGVGRVDVVKIDVEGYEWRVLRGMRRTIAEFLPHVECEIHFGTAHPQWDEQAAEFQFLFNKTFAILHTDRVALGLAPVIYGLGRALYPVARLLVTISNVILPGKGLPKGPFMTEDEIRQIVTVAEEEEVIEEQEREMIHSIFEFGDTTVREVMVPRPDMVVVDSTMTCRDAMDKAIENGYSRIPVHEDDDPDNIIGLVYVKDLVKALRDNSFQSRTVKEFVREPYFVPETMKVSDLLRQMQKRKVHIAIVADEYGDVAGLVTLEDLLEEIVGEIVDEYDAEPVEPVVPVGDNGWLVQAKLPIWEFNEKAKVELPDDEEWKTIGGLVASVLGNIPEPGDHVKYHGFSFRVERMQRRRIDTVLVQRVETSDGAA